MRVSLFQLETLQLELKDHTSDCIAKMFYSSCVLHEERQQIKHYENVEGLPRKEQVEYIEECCQKLGIDTDSMPVVNYIYFNMKEMKVKPKRKKCKSLTGTTRPDSVFTK